MKKLKPSRVHQKALHHLLSQWQREGLTRDSLIPESTFFPLHTPPLSKQPGGQELHIKYLTSYSMH